MQAVHAKVRLVYVSLGVLLSANGVILSEIFNNFLLMEFLCLWRSTVVGVLLSSSYTFKKNI